MAVSACFIGIQAASRSRPIVIPTRSPRSYDRTADFLRNIYLGEAELTQYRRHDRRDRFLSDPARQGFYFNATILVGDTDEAHQRVREEVVSTTIVDMTSATSQTPWRLSLPAAVWWLPIRRGQVY
jgi:hypothetical protein